MKLKDIDMSVCLSLDVRCNEWEELDREFEKREAKIERYVVGKGNILPLSAYDFVDPIDIKPSSDWYARGFTDNAYYCYLSHREILKRALDRNVQNVLMMEDDCKIMDNFDVVLGNAFDQLEKNNIKWDMLYLGANHTWGKTKTISDNILKCLGGTYCWHCVIINQKYFFLSGKFNNLFNTNIPNMFGMLIILH